MGGEGGLWLLPEAGGEDDLWLLPEAGGEGDLWLLPEAGGKGGVSLLSPSSSNTLLSPFFKNHVKLSGFFLKNSLISWIFSSHVLSSYDSIMLVSLFFNALNLSPLL